MKTHIKLYTDTLTKVRFFFKQLNINITKHTGRPLAATPQEIIALALFKQSQGIPTKKAIWKIFACTFSYKTLVVSMNRLALYALLILEMILKEHQQHAHVVKHTDSTDIPVSLNKNAKYHKVMQDFASWGYSGKGFYYGLKMSITTDLNRKLLAVSFGSGNSNDRVTFMKLNKDIMGIFVADAGYIGKNLAQEFYIEHQRILFARPKANMKKLITDWQKRLYDTRMLIELNFRNLKMFYGLVTSLPKSIDGYLGNYVYALLAYVMG